MLRCSIFLALVAFSAATSIYPVAPRELEGVHYCEMVGQVHAVRTSTGCKITPCDVIIGHVIWIEADFTSTRTTKFMQLEVTARAGIITIPIVKEDVEVNAEAEKMTTIRYEMTVPNLFAGLRATLKILVNVPGISEKEVCAEADVIIRNS